MKMTPMLLAAVLASGTMAVCAQNDDSTSAGQPSNIRPAAQPSSPSSNQDTGNNNAQGNLDRSGIKKAKPPRAAANAYANCGDYNVRSAAGSPPGSTDADATNNQNDSKQAQAARKRGTSRSDCPEKR